MPESVRLIKKYPNRRLYDTKTSSYITLFDVKRFVLSAQNFKVIDAKNGDDLTRSILLQILIDEESTGVPLFSTELLTQMIRFYAHSMQGMLGTYLEANVRSFSDFQKKLKDQSASHNGEVNGQLQSEMWSQFMNFQGPALQSMMIAYMDQSRKIVHQMHDQLKNQTINMLSGVNLTDLTGEEEGATKRVE